MKKAVIVIGLQNQGLSVVRSLCKSNLVVHTLIDNRIPKEIAEYTFHGIKHKFNSIKDLKCQLKEIQSKYNYKLTVFITSAYLLTEIREEYREIYQEYDVLSSPLKWVDLFSNKIQMYHFVEKYNIDTAPAILLTEYTPGCLKFPLVLKRNIEHYLSFKTKCVFNDKELTDFIKSIPDNPDDIIIQELVKSPNELDLSYQAYLYKGDIKASVCFEEVRHYPEGISSCLEEINGNLKEKVTNSSETILKQTDYSGFIQIDYKYTPENEKLIIMDINTRSPASNSAFRHKFKNYSSLFTDINHPSKLSPKKNRLIWINPLSDIRARIRSKDYTHLEYFFTAVWDIWSYKDPLPFIMAIIMPIIRKLKLK